MGRFTSDSGGGDFAQLAEGTHIARCYSMIDIGTHHGEYQGAPTVRNQVIVRWEVPGETVDTDNGPQPMVVSKFYTNSLSEKANMRKDLVSWRGKEFTPLELLKFDLQTIVGAPCMVTVAHNEKGKAKVVGVTGLPKGIKCPQQVNPSLVFWIDEWDQQKFESLPAGFQKLIEESDERTQRKADYAKPRVVSETDINGALQMAADDLDEIPF